VTTLSVCKATNHVLGNSYMISVTTPFCISCKTMAEGPWGPRVAVVPPNFSNFFVYYYYIIIIIYYYSHMVMNMVPIISICVILYVGSLFFWGKKAHYISLFAKLYYFLRLGPSMFKTCLHP